MRYALSIIILMVLVGVAEMVSAPFSGFYICGAALFFFCMLAWDFVSRITQLLGSWIVVSSIMYTAASVFSWHMLTWRFGIHVLLYELLIGICIYEITKRQEQTFKRS